MRKLSIYLIIIIDIIFIIIIIFFFFFFFFFSLSVSKDLARNDFSLGFSKIDATERMALQAIFLYSSDFVTLDSYLHHTWRDRLCFHKAGSLESDVRLVLDLVER